MLICIHLCIAHIIIVGIFIKHYTILAILLDNIYTGLIRYTLCVSIEITYNYRQSVGTCYKVYKYIISKKDN